MKNRSNKIRINEIPIRRELLVFKIAPNKNLDGHLDIVAFMTRLVFGAILNTSYNIRTADLEIGEIIVAPSRFLRLHT